MNKKPQKERRIMDLELWKKVKKEKKLKIADIASAANLPKGTVQNIFCGYIPHPRIDTVQAIERALGLNSAQSYANDGLKTESVAKSLSEKETRLLDAFNGLIPPMQDYILDMVEKLVAQPQNANKRA